MQALVGPWFAFSYGCMELLGVRVCESCGVRALGLTLVIDVHHGIRPASHGASDRRQIDKHRVLAAESQTAQLVVPHVDLMLMVVVYTACANLWDGAWTGSYLCVSAYLEMPRVRPMPNRRKSCEGGACPKARFAYVENCLFWTCGSDCDTDFAWSFGRRGFERTTPSTTRAGAGEDGVQRQRKAAWCKVAYSGVQFSEGTTPAGAHGSRG